MKMVIQKYIFKSVHAKTKHQECILSVLLVFTCTDLWLLDFGLFLKTVVVNLIWVKFQAIRQLRYSHFKKSLLASCSDSGAVALWDTNKRQLIYAFTDSHKAPAMGIAFSPLNEMLLMSVGLDKRIVCYDVQNKQYVTQVSWLLDIRWHQINKLVYGFVGRLFFLEKHPNL